MASFMRKLAPQLVTPDRQLRIFLPDILSFARIFFPPANSPLIVSPHLPRTYLPIPASCPRLGFRPTYLFKPPFGPQQTPYPASVRNPGWFSASDSYKVDNSAVRTCLVSASLARTGSFRTHHHPRHSSSVHYCAYVVVHCVFV